MKKKGLRVNMGMKKIMVTGINLLVTNGLSHSYHLDESIFILGESGVFFHFYFNFR